MIVKRRSGRMLQPERLGVLDQLLEQTVVAVEVLLEQRGVALLEQLSEVATHVHYHRVVRQAGERAKHHRKELGRLVLARARECKPEIVQLVQVLLESEEVAVGRQFHVIDLREELALPLDARSIHKSQRPTKKGSAVLDGPALPILEPTCVLGGVQAAQVHGRVKQVPHLVALVQMLVPCQRTLINEFLGGTLGHLRRIVERIVDR